MSSEWLRYTQGPRIFSLERLASTRMGRKKMIRAFLFAVAVTICGTASAEKSPLPGAKAAQKQKHSSYFNDRHWKAVREHFNEQLRTGKCPLGLVTREDGCELANPNRRWAVGKSLPPEAIRFDLPKSLATKLGKPPSGHRYVRVGADVLLVSNRTGMVVDGVLDLGRK